MTEQTQIKNNLNIPALWKIQIISNPSRWMIIKKMPPKVKDSILRAYCEIVHNSGYYTCLKPRKLVYIHATVFNNSRKCIFLKYASGSRCC